MTDDELKTLFAALKEMRENETEEQAQESRGKHCAYCLEKADGNYSIHRDGFGVGPEVALCDKHGSRPSPTCEEIWYVIARRRRLKDDANDDGSIRSIADAFNKTLQLQIILKHQRLNLS
jgi:uncharacterized protein with FMN-binding domain